MSFVSVFHLASLATLVLVLWSGTSILFTRLRGLSRLDLLGVALSTAGAAYWLVMSYLLLNIVTCRAADPTLCITGSIYHLLRNGAFLAFHLSVRRRAKAA